MENANYHIFLAIDTAMKAGEKILRIYRSEDMDVEYKSDESPLTLADKQSHETIMNGLQNTGYPVLSEEGADIPYAHRAKWGYFWLVDPLDGTKEFIGQNGEFTVNIGLVDKNIPVLGVIYVPATDELYFSSEDTGSYKLTEATKNLSGVNSLKEIMEQAQKLPITTDNSEITVVGSRSHMNEETKKLIAEIEQNNNNKVNIVSRGSSLKLCMVAEGNAQFYPRLGPTMEWDTAAGHAIVRYMGGDVIISGTSRELTYNKEDLHNPYFIVKYNLPQ